MHSRKTVPIIDLMSAANMELIRLDFKSSTLSRHSKEFRSFSNYCRENEITAYDTETGPQYFQHCYGLDIGNSTAKLTKQQLDTRCSIRFLDDIFQFGYALRYSHHDYTVPRQYVDLLEEYLAWCHRNNSSDGTIRVKRTKIRQFFCFLDGRGIELSDLTAAEISDFMTTLCRYHRATIHVFSSVLRDFFRYLHENGILDDDLSRTLRAYFQNNEFCEAYRSAFQELTENATRRAQRLLSPALDTLEDVMKDADAQPAARTNAARIAIESAMRLTEQNDIMRQINELEEWRREVDGNR